MKDDLISTLSEIRSNYNCFNKSEEPYYRALSEAIKKLSERTDGDAISRQEAIKELEELNAISFYELNEHSKEAIKQMLKELQSAQSDNDWVPVTRKAHPDLPIRVQVQMDNGWIITAYYQEGEWLSVPDCGAPLKDEWIEAWRKLPEPYEERRATQDSQSDAIDECQNCKSYLRLKNGIHAMCLKEEVWDFCSRLENEDKERWED